MGGFVHITRRTFWATKQKGRDISAEEWQRYVQSDPEFKVPGRGGADFADWGRPLSGKEQWLYWADGEIVAKKPKAAFIRKIVAIADHLGAEVQDDDGKLFS